MMKSSMIERRAFKCPHCTKSFHCSSHLTTHVRTHTGEKPYKCGQCPKSFALLGNLTAHVRTHTGEKPYTCKYCSKSFTQSTNLNVHMRVHTGERPYKCQRCQKAFKTSGALNGHVKSCCRISDLVSRHHASVFRHSNNSSATFAAAVRAASGRSRGGVRGPPSISMDRSLLGLSTTASSSKLSSNASNDNNSMPYIINSSMHNRRKISDIIAKKRLSTPSFLHNRSVNATSAPRTSSTVTETQTSNMNTNLVSSRSLKPFKQEAVLSSSNGYSESSSSMENRTNEQEKVIDYNVDSYKDNSNIDNMVTLTNKTPAEEIAPKSEFFNKFSETSQGTLNKTQDTSDNFEDNKNFIISSDFSQQPTIHSNRESLTVNFNSVKTLSENLHKQSDNIYQQDRHKAYTQARTHKATSDFYQPQNSIEKACKSSQVGGTYSKEDDVLVTAASFSFQSKEKADNVIMPNVNLSTKRFPRFGNDKVIVLASDPSQLSGDDSSGDQERNNSMKNYSSEKFPKHSSNNNSDRICNPTSDTPEHSRNAKTFPKSLPYQKASPSKTSTSTDSYSDFIEVFNCAKIFKCSLCDLIFCRKDEFIRHMPLHEEDELLLCKFCEMDFKTPLDLVLHMQNHVLPEQQCELCDQMILSTRFSAHLSMHAASMKKIKRQTRAFWCPFCDKSFMQQPYLDLHLRVHANQKPIHFNSKQLPSNTSKEKMISTISAKSFMCPYCKKEFIHSKNLIIHLRSHRVIYPYRCRKCQRVLKNVVSYNNHQKTCLKKLKTIRKIQQPYCSNTEPAMENSKKEDNMEDSLENMNDNVLKNCFGDMETAYNSPTTAGSSVSLEKKQDLIEENSENSITGSVSQNYEQNDSCVVRKEFTLVPELLVSSVQSEKDEKSNDTSLKSSVTGTVDCESTNLCGQGDNEELPLLKIVTTNSLMDEGDLTETADRSEVLQPSESTTKDLTKTLLRCLYCPAHFSLKTSFFQHIKNDHDGTEHQCQFCGNIFNINNELAEHVNCYNSLTAVFKDCEHCPESFADDCDYQRHNISKHSHLIKNQNKELQDDLSKLSTKETQVLAVKVSVRNGYRSNLDVLNCNYCNKQFTKPYSLSIHIRMHHTLRNRNKCRYYDRGFPSQSHSYVRQVKTLTRLQSYRCRYCKKLFTNSTHLRSHLRVHTGEKPYKCKLCSISFSQHGNLTAHNRTHTNERPFRCKHCGKSFTQSTNLSVHMRVHANERPYKCNLCKCAFKTLGAHNSHIRSCNAESNLKKEKAISRLLRLKKSVVADIHPKPSVDDSELPLATPTSENNSIPVSSLRIENTKSLLSTSMSLDVKEDMSKLSDVSSTSLLDKSAPAKADQIVTDEHQDLQSASTDPVPDPCSSDQLPTIQGIYRNKFCTDVLSNSDSTAPSSYSTSVSKEDDGDVVDSKSLLSSVIADSGTDKYANTVQDSNAMSYNPLSVGQISEDIKDVLIENLKTESTDSITFGMTSDIHNNGNKSEEFSPTVISESLRSNSTSYIDQTEREKAAESIQDGYSYQNLDELQRSDVSRSSTDVFITQNSTISSNIDSQGEMQFTISQTGSPSEPYGDKEAVLEQRQQVTSLFKCLKCLHVFNSGSDYTEHMMSHIRVPMTVPSDVMSDVSANVSLQQHPSTQLGIFESSSMDQQQTNNNQQQMYQMQQNSMDQLSPLGGVGVADDSKTQLIQCILCPKRFTKIYSLAVHMKSHLQQQQQQQQQSMQQIHTCKVCPGTEVFLTAEDLSEHLKHHSEFKCRFCVKILHSSSQLETHLRTHTGEKPFECPHCPKTFAVNCNLIAHVRIHTGERPFKCQYCEKRFAQATNLNVHIRIHTGERPYLCKKCKRAFRTSSALKGHLRCCPI